MTEASSRAESIAPLAPKVDLPILEQLRCMREFTFAAVELRERYGPVCRIQLGSGRGMIPVVVWVSSPQGLHDVLGGFDGTADKQGVVHHEFRSLIADGSFSMPHATWQPRRRALHSVFTKKAVDGYARHMSAVARATIDPWSDRPQVDLDHEMRTLTLNVLGRSLFGRDLGDDAGRLEHHMPPWLRYVTRRMTQPVRMPHSLPTPPRARFRRHERAVHGVIADAVAAFHRNPDHEDAGLLRLLHEATDPETGRRLTAEEIRDELLILLIAGHDTTATTLTYALWQLGRNPDLQDQVAAEALALGRGRDLGPDDVRALNLTRRVIEESLRLFPPAPTISRRAVEDLVVDGYTVPKGAEMILSIYAVQRAPELWDDPLRFDPDRWLPERAEGYGRWQYLPFGGGPRACIGSRFATLEASLGLATIVREMHIESLDEEFEKAETITMTAKGPVTARVSRRT